MSENLFGWTCAICRGEFSREEWEDRHYTDDEPVHAACCIDCQHAPPPPILQGYRELDPGEITQRSADLCWDGQQWVEYWVGSYPITSKMRPIIRRVDPAAQALRGQAIYYNGVRLTTIAAVREANWRNGYCLHGDNGHVFADVRENPRFEIRPV